MFKVVVGIAAAVVTDGNGVDFVAAVVVAVVIVVVVFVVVDATFELAAAVVDETIVVVVKVVTPVGTISVQFFPLLVGDPYPL